MEHHEPDFVTQEGIMYCPICKAYTDQTLILYPDLEARSCHAKKIRHVSYWKPGGKELITTSEGNVSDDPYRIIYEFKRNVDRRYLTKKQRRSLGIDDEEGEN